MFSPLTAVGHGCTSTLASIQLASTSQMRPVLLLLGYRRTAVQALIEILLSVLIPYSTQGSLSHKYHQVLSHEVLSHSPQACRTPYHHQRSCLTPRVMSTPSPSYRSAPQAVSPHITQAQRGRPGPSSLLSNFAEPLPATPARCPHHPSRVLAENHTASKLVGPVTSPSSLWGEELLEVACSSLAEEMTLDPSAPGGMG
ncbi:unnamed protein product [Boreogadus saida]